MRRHAAIGLTALALAVGCTGEDAETEGAPATTATTYMFGGRDAVVAATNALYSDEQPPPSPNCRHLPDYGAYECPDANGVFPPPRQHIPVHGVTAPCAGGTPPCRYLTDRDGTLAIVDVTGRRVGDRNASEHPADCGPTVGQGVVAPCVIRFRADGSATIHDATGRQIGTSAP